MNKGYKTFDDIQAWQLGREYKKEIYQITSIFPSEEKFCLTQQIRRAAISITANLAEGYGRYSYQENINFCRMSRGSLNEVLDHLCTAYDMKYIPKDEFAKLYTKGRKIERSINGYINFLKKQNEK